MNQRMRLDHTFPPLCEKDSEILILGSFPSVLSRAQLFYYGNPRNRFWAVLGSIFHEDIAEDIESKRLFCTRHKIALYDVIESCDIIGSRDDSIENIVPADIQALVSRSKIRKIVLNGNAAKRYFLQYQSNFDQLQLFFMPSTSPANVAWSLDRLVEKWSEAFRD